MTYNIKNNTDFGSLEIYFSEKPAAAVLAALKNARFRWHGVKKCWYGYGLTEWSAADLINGATPDAEKAKTACVGDGYMGGGSYYGGNSAQNLHGQDLKKAILQEIKRAGLRGVTCKSGRGGTDSFTFSIRMEKADFVGREEYINAYEVPTGATWINYLDAGGKLQCIFAQKYWFDISDAEREEIKKGAAAEEYDAEALRECEINHYYLDKYNAFSSVGLAKIKKLCAVIDSFRWDESNSMVDYFNTNFYFDVRTIPVEV